jgi:hypothetical protein
MGKHMDELLRLGRLGYARIPIDMTEALAYHKSNRKALLQEMKELDLANPVPPEESHIDWAKRMNADARKKREA